MKYLLFTIFIIFLLYPITVFANKGCCSRHGGISYCGDNGYYICNDGSQSPSCVCTTYEFSDNNHYNSYNNEILNLNTYNTRDLENKISKLENEVKQLKNDSDTYKALFWITLVILIIYYFYKQAND